jgi:hypothetical protein
VTGVGSDLAPDSASRRDLRTQRACRSRSDRPTSLQFGPDGRLYVSQQDGAIKVFTVVRRRTNEYAVAAEETIKAIQSIPNHDDDGSSATEFSDVVDKALERLGL